MCLCVCVCVGAFLTFIVIYKISPAEVPAARLVLIPVISEPSPPDL